MTHEQACDELRYLARVLRRQAITLDHWADRVAAVIAEAYPDATPPSLPRLASSARAPSLRRTSSGRPIPPGVSGPPPVAYRPRAAAPDAP